MKKFILAQFVPALNSGGVEQGTVDVANYLAENNTKNIILSSGGIMQSHLDIKYTKHYTLPINSKNFLKIPFTAKKINIIIKKNNVNIIHIRSRGPAWLLPFIDKEKLVSISTFHNIYGHENFLKKIYNKGLAKTDYIVAISNYVKEEIIKLYNINPNKIVVINRGIDTNFFNPLNINETEFNNFIIKYNINKNEKNILYPGRLTEWKGQLEFIKIIKKFDNNLYNFYFAGDNKNISYTKKLINQIKKYKLEKKCKILGNLNKNELKFMYLCSDLIISAPLKPEGFGRIVSESLAMKKIVIAYDFGGVHNQLMNLDQIYKIKPYDQLELFKRIKLILNRSSNNCEKFYQNGRDHIIRNFSKNNMLEKYNDLYESSLF